MPGSPRVSFATLIDECAMPTFAVFANGSGRGWFGRPGLDWRLRPFVRFRLGVSSRRLAGRGSAAGFGEWLAICSDEVPRLLAVLVVLSLEEVNKFV
jgi:hypothetical protein